MTCSPERLKTKEGLVLDARGVSGSTISLYIKNVSEMQVTKSVCKRQEGNIACQGKIKKWQHFCQKISDKVDVSHLTVRVKRLTES